jgi:hypothetical protein
MIIWKMKVNLLAIWCPSPPEFHSNDRVASLVSHHPPEIEPGTNGTIVSARIGSLYAVQLPNGDLHRWFAGSELQPVAPQCNYCGLMCEGSLARITSTEGHPPHIKAGMVVKIVKAIGQVSFYDLMIDGKGYHRWLAGFEIVPLDLVSQK